MRRCAETAAAVLLLASATADGQTIRGETVDRGTHARVPGVVVLLVDSAGNAAARSLTNEDGEFRLSASFGGWYRIRALRLGFRPITTEAVSLAVGQELTKVLELSGIPVSLDTIRVAGRGACETRPDSAAATFAVWEQIRTALTAAQLTEGARALGARFVTYQRSLHPSRDWVLQQNSRITTGFTRRGWNAVAADRLRTFGYAVTDPSGTTYYAPDLAILLSAAFLGDHCFQLAPPPRSDPNRLGIAFEPTRDRKSVVEIRGTLWLNRRTSELQSLEFRYANLPREQEGTRAGGEMDFVRMKNGAWVITRWSIRMPVLERVEVVRDARSLGLGTDAEARIAGIRVEGGELALVTRGGDTLWTRPPLALTGKVLDSLTGKGLAGSRVSLRGTGLESASGQDGAFQLRDVLPGEYTMDIATPALRKLGVVHSIPIAFTDSATALLVRTPSAEQVVSSLCVNSRAGIVAGAVTLDTTPQPNVRVVLDWNEPTATGMRSGSSEARSDSRGAFRFCDAPVGTTFRLSARSDSGATNPIEVRLPATQRVVTMEVQLERALARAAAFAGTVVSDQNAQPLADVEIALPALSRNTFTNAQGAFRLADLPAGTYDVVARRVGYTQSSVQVALVANAVVDRRLVLMPVRTLDTITVSERSLIPSFDQHRRLGRGHFITRAELQKQEGRLLAEVLSTVPGLTIVRGGNRAAWVATGRHGMAQFTKLPDGVAVERDYCYAQVYLDNTWVNRGDPAFDINTISPASIEAIEFYSGPSETPAKYSTSETTCGTIVIHTRRHDK